MTLKLVRPSKKYILSVCEAIQEFQQMPSEFDLSSVTKMYNAPADNFESYFEDVKINEDDPQEGRVAQTTFWLVEDGKYIGTFDLRHELTPTLERQGGNIGYEIRPSMRLKGYGYRGLKLCVEKAEQIGLEKVLITCNEKNSASYALIHKLMLENGGIENPIIKIDKGRERRVWVWAKKRRGKIRPLAIAVIKRKNQVLAVKGYDEIKHETFYRLPGGGIEFGETAADALRREIKEEIGKNTSILRFLGVFENIFTFNGQKGHEIIMAYEANLSKELMTLNQIPMLEKEFEGKCYEFVDVDEKNKIYPEILNQIK